MRRARDDSSREGPKKDCAISYFSNANGLLCQRWAFYVLSKEEKGFGLLRTYIGNQYVLVCMVPCHRA